MSVKRGAFNFTLILEIPDTAWAVAEVSFLCTDSTRHRIERLLSVSTEFLSILIWYSIYAESLSKKHGLKQLHR